MTEREDSYIAGNKIGGRKAAKTNKERHGSDFYAKIGKRGGSAPKKAPGGFASLEIGNDGLTGPQRARKAGAIGGMRSRRGDKSGRPVTAEFANV